MKRLEAEQYANRRSATVKRLELEMKLRAAGYRVTGWRNGKPVVRKSQGAGHATRESRMA